MSDDEQMRQWREFYDRAVERGRCPYSGDGLVECHAVDLCDCFDFPHIAWTVREVDARGGTIRLVIDGENGPEVAHFPGLPSSEPF